MVVEERINKLRKALEDITRIDYRGYPHESASIARLALQADNTESALKPSRARNLTRALFDKVAYECKAQRIHLDTFDADFILGVMLEWLEVNDAALTAKGVRRFRR